MYDTDRRGRFLRYAPLILWIGVIFLASSTAGSMSNTSRFVRPFLIWLFPNAPEDLITVYHGYVRKSAHFIEYAILAFFASRSFWGSAQEILSRFWYVAAFAVVLVVASLDEFNQSFSSIRTGTYADVVLDCLGGLAMILVLIQVRFVRRNLAKRTSLREKP